MLAHSPPPPMSGYMHNYMPPMGPFSRANCNYVVYMMEHAINANIDRSIILIMCDEYTCFLGCFQVLH